LKTFIVLQNVMTFRVNWANLYDPEAHRLVLIARRDVLAALAAGQERYFDQVFALDDFSLETVLAKVLALIAANDGSEVRLITNDEYALGLAATLRERLGLAGDTVERIRPFIDKVAMKAKLSQGTLRLPKYVAFDPRLYRDDPDYERRIAAHLGFPIFAKPVNLSGSQATGKLENMQGLASWCAENRDRPDLELDEFVTGTLYHCDSLLRNGEVLSTLVSRCVYPCFDFLAGKSTGSMVLPKDHPDHARLAAFTREALTQLAPLPNCVAHLEVFGNRTGELVFLEVAARSPGGMVPQTYEKYTGVNIEENHFRLQMSLTPKAMVKAGPYAAWLWYPNSEGVVTEFRRPDIRSACEWKWNVKVGDRLAQPASLRDYAAQVLLWNDDYQELERDFASLSEARPYFTAPLAEV